MNAKIHRTNRPAISMKTPLVCLLYFCAISSSHAATVLADRIVLTKDPVLSGTGTHWTEVQAFQQGSGTNVAAGLNGGTATASSTGWGTSPSWAIDGNTDGAFGSNSSWHDLDGQAGDNPAELDVFTVVFSAPFLVDSFNIHGRTDCCQERDDIFQVEFYNGATLVASQSSGIGATASTGVTPIIPETSVTAAGLLALGLLGLRRRRA